MVRPPAPPPPRLHISRRSSFARRDSNLVLLGAILSGMVLAFALLLVVVQRVNPAFGSSVRGATADALSPMLAVVRAPVGLAQGLGADINEHWGTVRKNRELQQQVKTLAAKAAEANELKAEIARLQRLLKMERPERRVQSSAFASSLAASGGTRTAILSAGARNGVRPRMPVIAASGLAGRVTDVGTFSARMLLLTDGSSRVPVKVERNGWTGLAVGDGGRGLRFEYDPPSGLDRLRNGDRLVTSGDGGLFPPGVPVAIIADATQSPPVARPFVNPADIGPVLIEAPWLPPVDPVPTTPAADEADRPAPQAPAAPGMPPTAPGTTLAATPAAPAISRAAAAAVAERGGNADGAAATSVEP